MKVNSTDSSVRASLGSTEKRAKVNYILGSLYTYPCRHRLRFIDYHCANGDGQFDRQN